VERDPLDTIAIDHTPVDPESGEDPHAAWAFDGAGDETRAKDPGVRGGAPGAGTPIAGLSTFEAKYFNDGLASFVKVDATPDGLGPRFNLNQCAGCHVQPAVGGTSPTVNPQYEVSKLLGANNKVPRFISPTGPVREARFKFQAVGWDDHSNVPDGGVHSLFVIAAGRTRQAVASRGRTLTVSSGTGTSH
jgi:hypothetical protein